MCGTPACSTAKIGAIDRKTAIGLGCWGVPRLAALPEPGSSLLIEVHLIIVVFFVILVSSPYNRKHIEASVTVIWCYINNFELN